MFSDSEQAAWLRAAYEDMDLQGREWDPEEWDDVILDEEGEYGEYE